MQKRHVMIGSVRKKDLRIGFSEVDSWFVGEKEPGYCSYTICVVVQSPVTIFSETFD
jgi:hypothetical protein